MTNPPALMPLPKAVRLAAASTTKRGPLPIASNVLLEPTEHGIRVTGTDLQTTLSAEAEGSLNEAVCVPAHLLKDLLLSMPSPALSVSPYGKEGRTLALTGEGAEMKLNGWAADNFPPHHKDDWPESVPFDREAFKWVAGDAATDDSRPVLTGVCINKEDGAMVSSDGFRLRMIGAPFSDKVDRVNIPASIAKLIPPNCESILLSPPMEGTTQVIDRPAIVRRGRVVRQASTKPMTTTHSWARFVGDYTLTTQLIQGTFPNFLQLLPTEHRFSASVPRMALAWALRPLSLFAREGSGIVRFNGEPGKGLVLSVKAEEIGEASWTIPCDVPEPFKIALNHQYVIDAANGPSETVVLEGMNESSQLVVRYEDRLEVIMPMFVQW